MPTQFAMVVADADNRYVRIRSRDKQTYERFAAGSVGPIVYQPRGNRFAFVADHEGDKYLFEYMLGGERPLAFEPIQAQSNTSPCYHASGRYLFAIASNNTQWNLYVRDETRPEGFERTPIFGDPARLDLSALASSDIRSIPYGTANDSLVTEIQNWLK
jgi:hypothetical protein